MLPPVAGILFLGAVSAPLIIVALYVSRGRCASRLEFLVANRKIAIIPAAFSVAASWLGAPSLYGAAEKAYEQGIVGLLCFVIPNFACLIIFAPLAQRLRNDMPSGYTLTQYMAIQHGPAVHVLYLIQFFGLQVCLIAVQVVGGAALIAWLTGISITHVKATLIAIPLFYAISGGIRASIATDMLQMGLVFVTLALIIPRAITNAGGFEAVMTGFRGHGGDPPLWVVYSFGIPVAISLLSGPIGDQMQWQRGYILPCARQLLPTFSLGAGLFIIVPLSLSVLGFICANSAISAHWTISSSQLVGPIAVVNLLPPGLCILFASMLLASLFSTLDSVFCAVSSLVSTDVVNLCLNARPATELRESQRVGAGKIGMIISALIGVGIASVPDVQVMHLLLFYGTWRASTTIPTILTLCWKHQAAGVSDSTFPHARQTALDCSAAFWAILASLSVGAPLLVLGKITHNDHWTVIGSIGTPLVGGTICYLGSRQHRSRYP